MATDRSVLVPPRRLGTLLRQVRTSAGLEINELAARSGLTVVELDDLEHGRRVIDDELLSRLLALYGVEDAGLVPERSRLVIDLDEGRIAIEHGVTVEDGGHAVGEMAAPDAVLARYLALVYRLRDLPIGTSLALRDLDVEVLSTALSLDSSDIENRLHRLMADESEIERDQRRIRRRILLPIVGVVIAATGVGTLLLIAEDASPPDPVPTTTGVETGTARVADASVVDGADTAPAIADAAVVDRPIVPMDIGDPTVIDSDDTDPAP